MAVAGRGYAVNDELREYHCFESVDRVASDPQATDFKRRARLQQAKWRTTQGLPIGTQPMREAPGKESRPLGSRVELEYAYRTGCNFLDPAIEATAKRRVASPQLNQTLNQDRLYCDLLSSMPMCFNLFGILEADLGLADRAVHAWWPGVPGQVVGVHFEWSPGRRLPGRFLENASAFDVAFELDLGGGKRGIFGVETKYHEDCRCEDLPSDSRQARYRHVADASLAFVENAPALILGTDLQQIWLDHLLALSMTQDGSEQWAWSGFALVYPALNCSYAKAVERYRTTLRVPSDFRVTTIEDVLEANALPEPLSNAFRERYLWKA